MMYLLLHAALIAIARGADDLYAVLGVDRSASTAVIKKAYYKLAKAHHPDKVADPAMRAVAEKKFKRVAEAHSTLVDPAKRKEYDTAQLEQESHAASDEERRRTYKEYEAAHRRRQQPRQQHSRTAQQPQQQSTQQPQRQPQSQQQQRHQKQQRQHKQQQPRQEKVRDPNKSHEERARDQVRDVTSVLQLHDVLDESGKKLTHYFLLAMHDTRDASCQRTMRSIQYPFPFADYSQEWHGMWWGDLVLAATHDVGPALKAGRPSHILSTFEAAVGPAKRSAHGVSMPSCPTIILQTPGQRLGDPQAAVLHTRTSAAFQEWVWSFMKVGLTIRNEYPGPVRINWIHGAYVKEVVTLRPRESAERTVFLSHTLHAERIDRKGATISDGSSLLVFNVRNGSAMVIRPVECVDKTADCEEWTSQGECRKNPTCMCLAAAPRTLSPHYTTPASQLDSPFCVRLFVWRRADVFFGAQTWPANARARATCASGRSRRRPPPSRRAVLRARQLLPPQRTSRVRTPRPIARAGPRPGSVTRTRHT